MRPWQTYEHTRSFVGIMKTTHLPLLNAVAAQGEMVVEALFATVLCLDRFTVLGDQWAGFAHPLVAAHLCPGKAGRTSCGSSWSLAIGMMRSAPRRLRVAVSLAFATVDLGTGRTGSAIAHTRSTNKNLFNQICSAHVTIFARLVPASCDGFERRGTTLPPPLRGQLNGPLRGRSEDASPPAHP
jgi:hypothetical protein